MRYTGADACHNSGCDSSPSDSRHLPHSWRLPFWALSDSPCSLWYPLFLLFPFCLSFYVSLSLPTILYSPLHVHLLVCRFLWLSLLSFLLFLLLALHVVDFVVFSSFSSLSVGLPTYLSHCICLLSYIARCKSICSFVAYSFSFSLLSFPSEKENQFRSMYQVPGRKGA